MKATIQSPSAYLKPSKIVEKTISPDGFTTATKSIDKAEVYVFEDYQNPPSPVPDRFTSIDDLLKSWEAEDDLRDVVRDGRRWLAETVYGEDGDTVRTLRLRKGWSQVRLASELGTSQSHIARIERGTENLTIETCRKLASALEIDLNALDQALKRQGNIAQAKRT